MRNENLDRRIWYKKDLFRWVAVLPGSLFAGGISQFPLHWVLYATLSGESFENGLELLKPIEHFLSPIVLMVVVVLVGYKLAPSFKFKTSVILAVLWVLSALISIMFISTIHMDLRTVFTFTAILLALYFNWRKSKENYQN
ncbi:MAG: hypothetical protein V4664_00860 [Patescibacteria group bacterium]